MAYFFLLYRLRLKALLRSPAIITGAVFLTLTLTFALFLPEGAPAALSVGLLPRGSIAEETAKILKDNGDYTVLSYGDEAALRQDVLSGELHCGYVVTDEWTGETPVTAYYTKGSYLRPLLDQLVLSAYFEAKLPRMTQEYLDSRGYGDADGMALLEKQRREARTMEIELRTVGRETPLEDPAAKNMQPLLYAVMASLFLALAVVEALLTPEAEARAQDQLRAMSGHRLASAGAPALARMTVYLFFLALADVLLHRIWDSMYYPFQARMTALCLLALAGTALALAVGRLRRWSGVLVAMLPPWLLLSVFCSGALIDPALFPMGLGALRFLSPAWYALRCMAAF